MTNKIKICIKCNMEKQTSFFYRQSACIDGLHKYCKECSKKLGTEYRNQHIESAREKSRKYAMENRKKIMQQRSLKKDQINKYQRERKRKKYNEEPLFRLMCNVRRTTSEVFRGKKSQKTLEMLGCSFSKLMEHLEAQFKPGMDWKNYGKWHIDHIYPLSLAKSTEELQKLCHFSNLQPLWAIDNIRKSNKIC